MSKYVVCKCGTNIFLISIRNTALIYKCTHCGEITVIEINGNAD